MKLWFFWRKPRKYEPNSRGFYLSDHKAFGLCWVSMAITSGMLVFPTKAAAEQYRIGSMQMGEGFRKLFEDAILGHFEAKEAA